MTVKTTALSSLDPIEAGGSESILALPVPPALRVLP
jgi:hypothetical protein